MKYRNKVTGDEIEALHIYSGICGRDIFEFAGGLVDTLTDNTFEGGFATISGPGFEIIITMGDYLMKIENKLYILPEKEFEECFEAIKKESNDVESQIKFYVNKNNGNIVRAFKNLKKQKHYYSDPILELGRGLIMSYSSLDTVTKIQFKNDTGIGNIKPNDYIIREENNIYVLPQEVFETYFEPAKEKNIFNPVDNVVVSGVEINKERTVKDLILDMIIEEKSNLVQTLIWNYINSKIQNENQNIAEFGESETSRYSELVETRKLISNNFLDRAETDLFKVFCAIDMKGIKRELKRLLRQQEAKEGEK